MGRKRIHPKTPLQAKTPKAKMEGLSVKALQDLLWYKREMPKAFEKFAASDSLMKIYKILVHMPSAWQDGLQYKFDPAEKLNHVFGTDYRHIYIYKAIEPFFLQPGIHNEKIDGSKPSHVTAKKLREVKAGDMLLIRFDTRDEDLTVDVQILSSGELFQDTSEDYRNFIMDSSDIAKFRKHLKLISKDGQDEETFIGDNEK